MTLVVSLLAVEEMMAGVAATALLVNQSRAQRPELSRDRYAGAWIPEGQRQEVRRLARHYADVVYPHDDVVVSVRGRAVLDLLEGALRRDPSVTLVSVGAGFSAYPWLLPFRSCIEVDQTHVVAAKRTRAASLEGSGVLPAAEVAYVGVDLTTEEGVARMRGAVRDLVPPTGTVVVVVEGLLYYLPAQRCREVLGFAADPGRSTLGAAVSYWPTDAADNVVLRRQSRWFRSIGMEGETTLLEHEEITGTLGSSVAVAGPVALQQRYGVSPAVPESALVPEYVAVVQA